MLASLSAGCNPPFPHARFDGIIADESCIVFGGIGMKWHHVEENWPAFFDAILDKWSDADAAELEDIDGDQRAFVSYIANLTEQEPAEAAQEIRDWLVGELPSDVVMDPRHDDHSIKLSGKYLPEGEDEYDDDARFGDDGNDD